MEVRPHRDRLLNDLEQIRKELIGEVRKLKPEEIDWAPQPGMKSCRALLLEIATMEKECMHWLSHGEMLDWKGIENSIAWPDQEPQSALNALERVRAETLAYLNDRTEADLEASLPVPEEWRQFMGETIEPEEIVRWVTRHEYYHLGQLITYRWILGDNPYKRE
jgi:uncharacterized damage-inducible protein DinB